MAPWWKRRVIAVFLTMALAVFILAALTLVLIGPAMATRATEWLGFDPVVASLWAVTRWPIMIGCVMLAMDLIYYFAPNHNVRWKWLPH